MNIENLNLSNLVEKLRSDSVGLYTYDGQDINLVKSINSEMEYKDTIDMYLKMDYYLDYNQKGDYNKLYKISSRVIDKRNNIIMMIE